MTTIHRLQMLAIAAILPLALGACGTMVGAGAGAYAGNQVGHGDGKTAATVGGAVLGGAIGHGVTGD